MAKKAANLQMSIPFQRIKILTLNFGFERLMARWLTEIFCGTI